MRPLFKIIVMACFAEALELYCLKQQRGHAEVGDA